MSLSTINGYEIHNFEYVYIFGYQISNILWQIKKRKLLRLNF